MKRPNCKRCGKPVPITWQSYKRTRNGRTTEHTVKYYTVYCSPKCKGHRRGEGKRRKR